MRERVQDVRWWLQDYRFELGVALVAVVGIALTVVGVLIADDRGAALLTALSGLIALAVILLTVLRRRADAAEQRRREAAEEAREASGGTFTPSYPLGRGPRNERQALIQTAGELNRVNHELRELRRHLENVVADRRPLQPFPPAPAWLPLARRHRRRAEGAARDR